jgi:hypothetical protein
VLDSSVREESKLSRHTSLVVPFSAARDPGAEKEEEVPWSGSIGSRSCLPAWWPGSLCSLRGVDSMAEPLLRGS